jgi:hypothetical protein
MLGTEAQVKRNHENKRIIINSIGAMLLNGNAGTMQ